MLLQPGELSKSEDLSSVYCIRVEMRSITFIVSVDTHLETDSLDLCFVTVMMTKLSRTGAMKAKNVILVQIPKANIIAIPLVLR
jgi:hypothetical protein